MLLGVDGVERYDTHSPCSDASPHVHCFYPLLLLQSGSSAVLLMGVDGTEISIDFVPPPRPHCRCQSITPIITTDAPTTITFLYIYIDDPIVVQNALHTTPHAYVQKVCVLFIKVSEQFRNHLYLMLRGNSKPFLRANFESHLCRIIAVP
jgi:hypothetical protein